MRDLYELHSLARRRGEAAPDRGGAHCWTSPLEMFQDTLVHEKEVTAMINNLAAIAAEDKDYASSNMLVWFVDEQVEEEESAREMITACEAVEGNKFGLYMLDKELAARTYTQASPLATAKHKRKFLS